MAKNEEQFFNPAQNIESYKKFEAQEDEVIKFINRQS